MKLKTRPQDFKVFEVLREDRLAERGEHRVYLVTKSKLTSLEAADVLADAAGVQPGEVSMAGLKDRQGVTRQYMSLPRGKDVRVDDRDLKISTAGFSDEPLTSADSVGNRFELVVRDLVPSELVHLRRAIEPVREYGLPNYFDEQRFGNLRHGQGWIALDLMRGDASGALKRLIATTSPFEDAGRTRLKQVLWRRWGDWNTCRELAGKLGKFHSVFEHLKRNPDDLAGAFDKVARRERLIHLFAFQSHLWNRAVASWIAGRFGPQDRFTLRAREGKLVFPKGAFPVEEGWDGTFPLPGTRFEEVTDDLQRALLTEALALHHLTPEDFAIDVRGFAFKHEARPLVVIPEGLRVRPAEPDPEHRGRHLVKLSFQLPRGAYASLVLRRLFGSLHPVDESGEGRRRGGGRGRRGDGRGRGRGARRGASRRGRFEERERDAGRREGPSVGTSDERRYTSERLSGDGEETRFERGRGGRRRRSWRRSDGESNMGRRRGGGRRRR